MFSNEKEVLEFIASRDEETKTLRMSMSTSNAVLVSYYEGAHWIRTYLGYTQTSTGRVYNSSYRPDTGRMLVNDNEITKLTIKAAAATYPEKIYCDVLPPARDNSVSTVQRMQVLEDLLNLSIDKSGYLQARRDANHMRCICGTWGVGLRLTTSEIPLVVDGQTVPLKNRQVEAFDFDATRLMLDPANRSRDLRNHEQVVYFDVISGQRIKQMFGIDIPKDELTPIGELADYEMQMSTFTEGRLYSRYRYWSRTPGAYFYQIHERGLDGNFRRCFYVLKTRSKTRVINAEDPSSPFGGDGLPMMLLYGHRRGDAIWGISDASLLKEGQDKRNTLFTLLFRHIKDHAGFKVVADKRWFDMGHRSNTEDIRNQITNAVGGVVVGGASGDRNVAPPQYIQTPPPQPFIMDLVNQLSASMRENVFRSEGNFGMTKCIDGDALVSMADGTRKRMKDVRSGDLVVSLNNASKVVPSVVKWHVASGVKPCFDVCSERGFVVTATEDHKVLTYHGWKKVGELSVGDWIVAPKKAWFNESGCTQRDLDEAVILAVWIAEGDKTRMDSYAVTNGNDEIRSGLISAAKRMGWDIREDRNLRIRLLKNGTEYGPNDLLKKHGVRTMTTRTVRIPDSIMRSDDRVMRTFLSYLFACDGGAFKKTIGYCSNSRALCDDIRNVLLRYGVRCSISKNKIASVLRIGEQGSIAAFASAIGMVGKSSALSAVVEEAGSRLRGSNNFNIPSECRSLMKHGYKWYSKNFGMGVHRNELMGALSESTAVLLAEREDNAELREIVNRDVEYVRVRSVSPAGDRETYDMEVEGTHCFVADNVVVHNSHVPDSSFARAIEESGQVLGIRVNEDITQGDERLLPVLLGTMVANVQGYSPGTLAYLRKEGFDDSDFAELAVVDPDYPACEIKVRDASARYRSAESKRQQLTEAVQLQIISPDDCRRSMASDLDTPMSDDDRYYLSEIRKAVDTLLRTGEYEPMSWGTYTSWAIRELQKAQLDPRCKADPALREAVRGAIIGQQQYAVQEQMMLQVPEAAGAGGEPASQSVVQPDPFDGLLTALQNQTGGGGVPGQPASGGMPAMAG